MGNLKPIEIQHLQPSVNPVETAQKYQKQVHQMKKKALDANTAYVKAKLATRLSSPPWALTPIITPVFEWREDWDNYDNLEEEYGTTDLGPYISTTPSKGFSRDPLILLGEEDNPYNFDELDYNSKVPRQVGPLIERMDVDDEIADLAGLSEKAGGKRKERQVSKTLKVT
jgi:hypothetical protein